MRVEGGGRVGGVEWGRGREVEREREIVWHG